MFIAALLQLQRYGSNQDPTKEEWIHQLRKSKKEQIYVKYSWFTFLYNWNNTVKQIYSNKKTFQKTDEWIKKMWWIYIHVYIYTCIYTRIYMCIYVYIYIYVCAMEYYWALKKNDILPFLAKWVDVENTMISEITHTEKDKYSIL